MVLIAVELSVLAVEDEPLALDELVHQLESFPEVAEVVSASDTVEALRLLQSRSFDAAFLDIGMPGLDGMELAWILSRLASPPAIVFTTASESHAVAAYQVGALDYLIKPLCRDRVAEALRRITQSLQVSARPEPGRVFAGKAYDVLKAEDRGRIRFVRREQVGVVEARGDYVRLHTAEGAFMVRMPLSTLEENWSGQGFVRVHRGFLVALSAVVDLHTDELGQLVVHTSSGDAPVSRRYARRLKEQLMDAARRGRLGRAGR